MPITVVLVGDDLEADAEPPGNEGGRRQKEPTVDVIPEEPGSDSLTMEGDVVTPRPNGMLYNEGVRSTRQTPLSRMWERTLRNRPLPSPTHRSFTSRRIPTRHEPPRDRLVKLFYTYLFGVNRDGFVL